MGDCIFCKIIAGEVPSQKIYEDEQAIAFHDINPAAPVHILVVPRLHIPSFDDIEPEHRDLLGHLNWVVKKVAREQNVSQNGYRVLVNCGQAVGQEVFHLHFHLLGEK